VDGPDHRHHRPPRRRHPALPRRPLADRLRRLRRLHPAAGPAIRHRHELDREGLLDRFASISFVAALPDAARASVLAEIEQVVEAEPSLAGPGPVMVPYRTDLFWSERREPIHRPHR
jgi:hypothetical protein